MIYKKSHFLAFTSCAAIAITILLTLLFQINIRISAQLAADSNEARAISAERERDQLERQATAAHDRHKKLLRSLKRDAVADSLPSSPDSQADEQTVQEIKIPAK